MSRPFYGGPFQPGFHEALIAYLESQGHVFPPIDPEPQLPTEADVDRVMPRHFALSIPSDPIPGLSSRRPRCARPPIQHLQRN